MAGEGRETAESGSSESAARTSPAAAPADARPAEAAATPPAPPAPSAPPAEPPEPPRLEYEIRPLRLLRAEDLMSRRVVMIDGGSSVAEAVRRMRADKVSSLITERRGTGDAWGIVTRADVIRKVIEPGLDPTTVRVYEVMTKPIITVSPGLLLKFCLKLMSQARVRRAAVFDGHRLVGVLTDNDIFRALKV